MKKMNWIKVLGIFGMVIGFGADIIDNYVKEKEIKDLVDEKVKDALSNKE